MDTFSIFGAPPFPYSNRPPHRRLVQLTGRELADGNPVPEEIADPAPPRVTPDGRVQVYGTATYYLEYPSWDAFISGAPPSVKRLAFFHPDGTAMRGHHRAWDVQMRIWPTETLLYAGSMTPTQGRCHAHWPQDNWTRRLYAYRQDASGRWTREAKPLFGDAPAPDSKMEWLGHCYGHHFIDDGDTTWLFYERVTEEMSFLGQAVPFRTEIFARKMLTPVRADDHEISILSIADCPHPATHRRHPDTRDHAGHLVEGPRPTRVNIRGIPFFILGFSSGDFPTSSYGINVAWSRGVVGPYTPLLTPDGSDLQDIGTELRDTYELSWGPARPAFFQDPQGEWWVFFHAVHRPLHPDHDFSAWPKKPLHHFHRNIYIAPVEFDLDGNGNPTLQLSH